MSYLISLWINQFNWSMKPEGPALAEPENLVWCNSIHVSLSTAYLAVSMADLIILIKTWYLVLGHSESTGTRSPTETLLLLFSAFAPINVGA